MTLLAVRTWLQESLDDLEGQLGSDDPAADAEHVHVVVLDALVSRIGVVTDRRADAGDLVRRHADADAAATDDDPAIGVALDDLAGDRDRKVGVVAARLAVGAAIDQGVTAGRRTARQSPALSGKPAWSPPRAIRMGEVQA